MKPHRGHALIMGFTVLAICLIVGIVVGKNTGIELDDGTKQFDWLPFTVLLGAGLVGFSVLFAAFLFLPPNPAYVRKPTPSTVTSS